MGKQIKTGPGNLIGSSFFVFQDFHVPLRLSFQIWFWLFFCSLVFQRKQYNPFFVIVSKNAAHLKRRKYGSPVVIEYSLLTVIDRLLFYTDPLTCNCNPSVKVLCWYFGLFHLYNVIRKHLSSKYNRISTFF